MSDRPDARDAYAVLGVHRDSDDAAITAVYHRLARRHHPDIAGDEATRRMMAINAAFDLIRTPERRADYDLELAANGLDAPRRDHRPPATPHASPGPSRDRRASERDGTGGAGPAPGRPSGTVICFGRHIGWSIGEIARVDPGYLVWLAQRREGQPYVAEIHQTLRRIGYRT